MGLWGLRVQGLGFRGLGFRVFRFEAKHILFGYKDPSGEHQREPLRSPV